MRVVFCYYITRFFFYNDELHGRYILTRHIFQLDKTICISNGNLELKKITILKVLTNMNPGARYPPPPSPPRRFSYFVYLYQFMFLQLLIYLICCVLKVKSMKRKVKPLINIIHLRNIRSAFKIGTCWNLRN